MKTSQIHTTDKSIAAIAALCACLWIGCTFARYQISYDVFVPGTTTLRVVSQEMLMNTIRMSSNLFGFCITFYSVMLLSCIVLAIRLKSLLKPYGFYFMAMVLVFITLPAELYLGYSDWKMFTMFPDRFSIPLTSGGELATMFIQRFTTQSVVGILSLLSIITAVTFLIWQPLSKRD